MWGRWRIAFAVLAAGLVAAPAAAHEFLVNGDFEMDVGVGWVRCEEGWEGEVERRTDLDEDPDFELRIWHGGTLGHFTLKLVQRVAVPNLDLTIAAALRCEVDAAEDSWSAAGLCIRYLDRDLAHLGETVVIAASRECPWVSTPTFHIIEATAGEWERHSLTLADELPRLPGVDPSAIAILEIGPLYVVDDC